LAAGKVPKRVPRDVAERAVRKLFLLDTVTRLEDLRVPPGNRLEALGCVDTYRIHRMMAARVTTAR
jgi:plasmid maintenance system killer protein